MSPASRPCPVCRDPLPERGAEACPRCATAHHAECWDFAGGCTRFGCGAEPSPRAERVPRPPSLRDLLGRPWWALAGTLGGLLGTALNPFLAAMVVLTAMLDLLALDAVFHPAEIGPGTLLVFVAAAFASALIACVARSVYRDLVMARIIPYYETTFEVEGEEGEWIHQAWRGGSALAAHFRTLDARTRQLGLTPLAELGFGDDRSLLRRAITWLDPEEVLKTLRGLAKALDQDPRPADPWLREDLAGLGRALEVAAARGVRVELFFRFGSDDLIYPMEMWERKGTFFPVKLSPLEIHARQQALAELAAADGVRTCTGTGA